MGKKRQKERFDILLFAAGLFCIGMTLWILISEISEYVQQKDWTAATAVVVDVSPHSGDYDVYYQYEAAGDIYTGKFSKVSKRALGETIEIRYNPDAPEKSNWVLEMGIKTILKDVFMIAIFWTLGARLIECALPKKKRREDRADGRAARRVPRQKPRASESTVDAAEVKRQESRIFQEVCELVRALREEHPDTGYAVRLERSAPLEPAGCAPARYSAWLIVTLSRHQTILESGEDTTEWPDARAEITRVRGGKLKVSDAYRGLLTADLEKITADYEACPDTYVENRAASVEMLAQACRMEWIEE